MEKKQQVRPSGTWHYIHTSIDKHDFTLAADSQQAHCTITR